MFRLDMTFQNGHDRIMGNVEDVERDGTILVVSESTQVTIYNIPDFLSIKIMEVEDITTDGSNQ